MSKPSRIRRVVRWCAWGLVFLLVAGAGGMWWAHRHLAKLIVGSFNRTSPGLEMTAKAAVLSGFDELALKSVRVRVRRDGSEVLRVPAATMRFSWRGLRAHFIREIVIEQPRFRVTDALLAALPAGGSGGGETVPWRIGHLAVQGGVGRVDLAAQPRVDFDFAVELGARAVDGTTPVSLALAALRVRLRGDEAVALEIPGVQVQATLEGLRARKVRGITIAEPKLAVTDALLAAFPAAAETPPADQPASAPWMLERLTLTGGRASLDLAGAPLVQARFAAQLGDDLLPPREPGELQAGVDFTDIAVRARGTGLEPFLRVPAVRTKFRLPEVQRDRRVASVQVEGFDFRFNKAFRDLIAAAEKPALPAGGKAAPDKPASPFRIGELLVTDGGIHLDDLGLGLPSIGCRVNTTFRNLALAPEAGAGGQELQTIELSRIALTSPLDPFVSVMSLETIFVRFTLAGIWRREIEEVAIIRPRIDIGPDLFWYIDRVQKTEPAPGEAAPSVADAGPDWLIKKFSATSGQLFLALEGHSEVALPMPFSSHAENLNFRKLADLRLKLSIEMPEQDYHYPGYELALRGVAGRVEFSLPPTQGANNVVNTLRLREVRWKQFRGSDCYVAVTYDERGIYGHLGGKGYGGVVNGQFNLLLGPGSPWNGWLSGTRIELKPITDALAPEKLALSGPANFHLSASARGPQIEQVTGDFSATRGGALRIGKIDDLIKELPGDWSGVKRGLSRISLEALRDFAYDTAHGDFRFHGREGALRLDLRGPAGSRKFAFDFHDAPARRPGGRVAAQRP